jgi:hypothetical protein
MKKNVGRFLKISGLVGGVFVLVFGSIKNFLRTIRLALDREN